jgi:hypothetical protein
VHLQGILAAETSLVDKKGPTMVLLWVLCGC